MQRGTCPPRLKHCKTALYTFVSRCPVLIMDPTCFTFFHLLKGSKASPWFLNHQLRRVNDHTCLECICQTRPGKAWTVHVLLPQPLPITPLLFRYIIYHKKNIKHATFIEPLLTGIPLTTVPAPLQLLEVYVTVRSIVAWSQNCSSCSLSFFLQRRCGFLVKSC